MSNPTGASLAWFRSLETVERSSWSRLSIYFYTIENWGDIRTSRSVRVVFDCREVLCL